MPYLKEPDSWRIRLRWLKLSRFVCFFGKHFYFFSSVTNKPIICVICKKKTRHYEQ